MLWLQHLQPRLIETTLLLAFFRVCQGRSHVIANLACLHHSCFVVVCCCLQVYALYRSFRRLWLDISAFSCRGRHGKSFVSPFFQTKRRNSAHFAKYELLNKIGLPSLENQRLAKIVCTAVFNAINNEHAPKSIKELIGLRNNKYNLRGSDILKRPKASTTTYGLKSWRFTAPKLWNSLPDSSRTVTTYKAFKNSIRTLDLAGLL